MRAVMAGIVVCLLAVPADALVKFDEGRRIVDGVQLL